MSLAATKLLPRAGTAPVGDMVPSGWVDIPSSSQETLHFRLCFHAWISSVAAPWWAQRQQICNILHYIFPSAKRNSRFSGLLGIKSTISSQWRKYSCIPLPEIHPTSPVHTQAPITRNSWYHTKKSHSATPGSASKGNVNVKGKVFLVCRVSIIQLEISTKILCSLVFWIRWTDGNSSIKTKHTTQKKVTLMTCSYKQNKPVQLDEVLCWLHLAPTENLKIFPPLPLFLKRNFQEINKKTSKLFLREL